MSAATVDCNCVTDHNPERRTGVSFFTAHTQERSAVMSRRTAVAIVTAVIAVLTALITPAAQAAGAYCGIYWGSLAKSGTGVGGSPSAMADIRAGQHECYDRLVIDFEGG